MSFSTRSDMYDDSTSSDTASYYCTDCDTRHDMRPDATPYVCDSSRPFGNLNPNLGTIGVNHDYPITRASPAELARYHIYAIDPVTGQEIPDVGGGEASNSN